MIATLVQKGDVVDFVAAADVAAGDVVVVGDLVGIAQSNVLAGETGAMAVTGVYNLPKETSTGSAIAAGAKAYWDETAKLVTKTAASNKLLGKAVLAAGDGDESVQVLLSQ